jgi:hypothetical protein
MKNTNDMVNKLIEEIEDTTEDTAVTYEVWAIGYDGDRAVTDTEMFVKEFNDPDKAVEYAKQLTLADIVHIASENDNGKDTDEVAYISVEVETVINDTDDEFIGGTMNIGTIFKKEIWFKEDLKLTEEDYTLLEDGTIKVSCDLMKGFEVDDIVRFLFVGNCTEVILNYKIISKVDDYYICEFIY